MVDVWDKGSVREWYTGLRGISKKGTHVSMHPRIFVPVQLNHLICHTESGDNVRVGDQVPDKQGGDKGGGVHDGYSFKEW